MQPVTEESCAAQHMGLWACEPRRLGEMVSLFNAGKLPRVELDEHDRVLMTVDESGIATIPIHGKITKGVSSFGGASSVKVRQALRHARADDDVKGIMLHIDSPGGTVAGTPEMADEIARTASEKPLHAHGEDLMVSAALWAGSQANFVSANATAEVGSIGTIAVVSDHSGAYEQMGIRVIPVASSGATMKGAFVPGTEVTEQHVKWLQGRVDEMNDFFLKGVKRGRKMGIDDVRKLATGEAWLAKDAMENGLIDAVMSYEQAVMNLKKEVKTRESARTNRKERRRQIRSRL